MEDEYDTICFLRRRHIKSIVDDTVGLKAGSKPIKYTYITSIVCMYVCMYVYNSISSYLMSMNQMLADHSAAVNNRSVVKRIANHTYTNAPRDVFAIEAKSRAGVRAISECPLQGIPLVRSN